MFIVLLKFSDNKGQAGEFMEGHNEWIKRGKSRNPRDRSSKIRRTAAISS
jgi:hypothetical protein